MAELPGSSSSVASEQSCSSSIQNGQSESKKHFKIKEGHVHCTHPHMDELLTLADLAGIVVPEKLMKVLIELLAMGVSPSDCHQLLRTAISNKRSSHRSAVKHVSKRHQSVPSSVNIA